MTFNLTDAKRLLAKQQRRRSAHNNLVISDLISKKNNEIKDKTQNSSVALADKNFVLKNDNVKNTITVQSGTQKVYNAIRDVSSRYPTYNDTLSDVRRRRNSKIISDNTNNYDYVTLPATEQDSVISKVLSDPDKPNTVPDNSNESKRSDIFNVRTLYERNTNVNPYEYNYSNSINNSNINLDRIVSFSDQGVITSTAGNYSMPRYHLIPADQLVQKEQYSSVMTPYSFNNIPSDFVVDLDEEEFVPNSRTYKDYKYRYSYCLNNPIMQYKDISKAAGFVSQPISVSSCSYVELSAEQTLGVEYYVIDGNVEVPILPRDTNYVKEEKLFFGFMPRFAVAEPNDIIVKKNGILTGITTMSDLETFLIANTVKGSGVSFDNNYSYTISYKPNESAKRYFPKSDIIKVKGIQRIIVDIIPCNINNIKILKFGNKRQWQLSSFESDIDYNPANPVNRRG